MDLKCNLAFDQDQKIIEGNNLEKQEGVLILGLFLWEPGSHKALSSCGAVSRHPNDTRFSAIGVRRSYCSP